jgi:hypothetical protein
MERAKHFHGAVRRLIGTTLRDGCAYGSGLDGCKGKRELRTGAVGAGASAFKDPEPWQAVEKLKRPRSRRHKEAEFRRDSIGFLCLPASALLDGLLSRVQSLTAKSQLWLPKEEGFGKKQDALGPKFQGLARMAERFVQNLQVFPGKPHPLASKLQPFSQMLNGFRQRLQPSPAKLQPSITNLPPSLLKLQPLN